jgi:hypothetical protein
MTIENENVRRLVLLLGDVHNAEVKLSDLRNRVMDNIKEMPEYVRDEIPELGNTILRVNREFGEILTSLLTVLRLST